MSQTQILNVIFAAHARSTHHKLALDALTHLQNGQADRWRTLILSQHSAYLDGAKAPDDDFKDFRNHVLHVSENFWGGAVSAAQNWYGTFVDLLRAQDWKEAAYAAGVLSHYYSDPLMPFHTGQSEAEGAVHRACEWSVTQSYDTLKNMMVTNRMYPAMSAPASSDWLGDMVRTGAQKSHAYYELLIDHYNLSVGVKNPQAGMDLVAQQSVAECLAHATVGFAAILDRAFVESASIVPDVPLTLQNVLSTINVPIRKLVNKLADARDKTAVEAIWKEVQTTGKAVESLPESEKLVRQFHAAEVLKVPLSVLDAQKPKPAGQKYVMPPTASLPAGNEEQSKDASVNNRLISLPGRKAEPPKPVATPPVNTVAPAAPQPVKQVVPPVAAVAKPVMPATLPMTPPAPVVASPPQATPEATLSQQPKPVVSLPEGTKARGAKYYLTMDADIVDAPSIGPKTASRFQEIGIRSISEFMNADVNDMAAKFNSRQFSKDVLRDWQDQSRLMLTVPGLRGHDAQLLVAAEIRNRDDLSRADAEQLLYSLDTIVESSEGRRILRDSAPPDLAEVRSWISGAISALTLKAG
ncbi:MAG: DUF4332 domain-containing protein [Planctomycetaceae bacterium]|nr:DUF4332 domain-containing protein [Planctomycetaceae bacterium]